MISPFGDMPPVTAKNKIQLVPGLLAVGADYYRMLSQYNISGEMKGEEERRRKVMKLIRN
jgi:hypothetical protein